MSIRYFSGQAACLVVICGVFVVGVRAQATAATLSFEVAAIRPAALPTSPEAFRGGQFRTGMQLDAGRLDWGFASLADIIQYAFGVKNYQVSAPDWIRESRWNIVARLPEGASTDQAPQMMQNLLIDRFGLKFHREKRDQPVYELTVAKGGPKLEAAADDPNAPAAPAGNANQGPGLFPGPFGGGPLGRGPGPGGPPPDAPDGRGGRAPVMMTTTGANGSTAQIMPNDNCGLHLEMNKLTMQDLADTLTPFVDKPVIDSTQLKGTYKLSLDLPMEVMIGMMQNMMRTNGLEALAQGFGGRGGGRGGDGGGFGGRGPDGGPGGRGLQGCDPGALFANGGADTSNAPIFQAVQKLGLKLEARKAPFDTIIVDKLEKTPSDN